MVSNVKVYQIIFIYKQRVKQSIVHPFIIDNSVLVYAQPVQEDQLPDFEKKRYPTQSTMHINLNDRYEPFKGNVFSSDLLRSGCSESKILKKRLEQFEEKTMSLLSDTFSAISGLTTSNTNHESEIVDLKQKVVVLKQKVVDLKQKVEDQGSEIVDLKQKVVYLLKKDAARDAAAMTKRFQIAFQDLSKEHNLESQVNPVVLKSDDEVVPDLLWSPSCLGLAVACSI